MTAFTALRGLVVHDPRGRNLGRLRDLIVDLGSPEGTFPVTAVVLGRVGGRHRVLRDVVLRERRDGSGLDLVPRAPPERRVALTEDTEVLVGRDVLDGPVVAQSPFRRARVADVEIGLEDGGGRVVSLDLSAAGSMRRLLGRGVPGPTAPAGQVAMSQVHLLSRHGHDAHLHDPRSWVFGLEPGEMAEALTRMPVQQARGVISGADPSTAERATAALHPRTRGRIAGKVRPRYRRLRGWRLHRPPRGAAGQARR